MAPEETPTVGGELDAGVHLLTDVATGVLGTVEDMHRTLAPDAHRLVASRIYDAVRVGVLAGGAVLQLAARTTVRYAPTVLDARGVQRAVGFANGAFAEHAEARGGAVPATMTVRLDGRRVDLDRGSLAAAYPSASGRVVVLLHGLVETDRSWFHEADPEKARSGTDFGSGLAADLPCTPVYVRYNTGRHISDNGQELVDLLGELIEGWPAPVREVVLVGHSMGGLVARSAVHQANERALPWLPKVTRLVCLGSPHTGAPLERGVVRLAGVLGGFAASAPLGRLLGLRSDGIKDLARGRLHRDQWDGGRSVDTVLPAGVRQFFLAVTLSRAEGSLWSRLVGDGLVAPSSAADPSQTADVRWLGGMHHFDLLHHDAVYAALLSWLRS
jgi:pimeloyl-ACP methyl ester carboxylesterase